MITIVLSKKRGITTPHHFRQDGWSRLILIVVLERIINETEKVGNAVSET